MNKIPSEFVLHGHTIKVKKVSETDDNNFGYYNDALEEIVVAENIRKGADLIPLTEIQILATFLHEFIHAMQWHSGKEYDEREAQTYSGLIIEFLNSRKYE
jgi:hypothetical protein